MVFKGILKLNRDTMELGEATADIITIIINEELSRFVE
jgi:hypothetical protein